MPSMSEKECRLALRWLKHTGFPHYAQQYENQEFPIVIDAEKLADDHAWLRTYPDALQTLLDRLQLLNQCALAGIRCIPDREDDSDDESIATTLEPTNVSDKLRGSNIAPARKQVHSKQRHHTEPSLGTSNICRQLPVTDEEIDEQDEEEDDGDDEKGSTSRRRTCPNPRVKLGRGARVTSRPKAAYCRQASIISEDDRPDSGPSSLVDGTQLKEEELCLVEDSSDASTMPQVDMGSFGEVGVILHHKQANSLVEEEEVDEDGEETEGTGTEELTVTTSNRRQRWHSFTNRHMPTIAQDHVQKPPNNLTCSLTVSRMQMVQHMSLLKLTSQLECYITPQLPKSKRQKIISYLDYTRKKTFDYDRTATLFGVPLDVLTRRHGHPLPRHIMFALDYILCRGIETHGLFRVAGSSKRIREFKKKASTSEDPIDFSEIPMPDIACLVKEYFRDIPGRLFTPKMTEVIILIGAFVPEELQIQAFQHIMLLLPDEHRETIFCILSFLRNISEHHAQTKMDVHNLAVVFAPTLFHLTAAGDVSNGHTSPTASRKLSKSKKKADYDESSNAISTLEMMITNVDHLQRVPMDTLMISLHTSTNPLDFTEAAHISELGKDADGVGDYVNYVEFCFQGMLKEHNSGYKNGWIQVSSPHSCEISKKKVRDGHKLQLWRGVVDVPANPADIQRRILWERNNWDSQFVTSQCLEVLDDSTEVYQYVCRSMPSQPNRESVVLRSWINREDISIIMATSVQHPKATWQGGVVITELATRYVIEPLAANLSRLTLITRHDLCGRSLNFYKNYGPWSVAQVCNIRDSFSPEFSIQPSPRSRPGPSYSIL
ncbi:rho GTPase-activating protein 7-like isoform X2 [Sycon ciliatum]|uniref:rho GTPase-activating protein 7-like isoform X2 n=1 Tax=Sycon ciliatum TaxID=27933 RepID=UPI0031F6118F|eukprot:scpid40362/ scgid1259/ Rho GTPase-activating protein 7; Deleted in liver cancer 1 protein homolog; Rho-type GTPase-activating protein 7; START domain-containing protein 12; StAR-related lipid transfer protein 12; p122-RhoGAP